MAFGKKKSTGSRGATKLKALSKAGKTRVGGGKVPTLFGARVLTR